MKKILYILLFFSINIESQIIVDHRHVELYDDIPQAYIDSIKKRWLSYAGESHSESIRRGLEYLEDSNSIYKVNAQESGTPNSATDTNLRVSRATWGDYDSGSGWIYSYGEEDWFVNTNAVQATKDGITYCNENGFKLDYIGFGWCWDHNGTNDVGGTMDPTLYTKWAGRTVAGPDGNTRWGLDSGDSVLTDNRINMMTYLNATRVYIEMCQDSGYLTKVFFTTPPNDNTVSDYVTGERGYQAYLKTQYIRDYVDTTDFMLFDFADILAHNRDGELATTSWTDYNSTLQTFPIIHSENAGSEDYHFSKEGAFKLAKAMWVFLAMAEGWDTTQVFTKNSITSKGFILINGQTKLVRRKFE